GSGSRKLAGVATCGSVRRRQVRRCRVSVTGIYGLISHSIGSLPSLADLDGFFSFSRAFSWSLSWEIWLVSCAAAFDISKFKAMPNAKNTRKHAVLRIRLLESHFQSDASMRLYFGTRICICNDTTGTRIHVRWANRNCSAPTVPHQM